MTEHERIGERGRAMEEEYFRKRDRELIEKLRKAKADEDAKRAMGESTGLQDPALLQELLDLGFTPDTVNLLPLVPVVQTAWAEGGVTKHEFDLVMKLAAARGIAEGSPAHRQLADWLGTRPAAAVFAGAGRLIRAMLASGSEQVANLTADDLVSYCEQIAGASGGMLGLGRVSADERALLQAIAADLKTRQG
jgi:hypothetical protein